MSAVGSSVEPFVERISSTGDATSPTIYRFGYRIEQTKDVLSTVDIPAETVEHALTAALSLSARMSPTGDVFPALADPENIAIAPSVAWGSESLESLVANAVDTDNLHLEDAGIAELNVLLARLENSVALVRAVLEQIRKSND